MRILTVSNAISCCRLLLVAPLAWALSAPEPSLPLVLGIFLAAYVSDLADGWLARRLRQVTEAGKVIDPLADKAFVLAAALLLSAQGRLPAWFLVLVILRDVVIFGAGALLTARRHEVPASTMTGKVAVVSIGVVLIAALLGDAVPPRLFAAGMGVSAALQAASLAVYGRRFFHRMHRPPAQESDGLSR
jgi:CDP-diacylglycerol--glycerol-3-phosphate 3-phosphatidyltransferase